MRLLKTLTLLIITLVIFAFVFTIYLVKFKSQSFIGESLREKFTKYPLIISLANLNSPGDLKYVYLDLKIKTLEINLAYSDDIAPNNQVNSWIKNMIKETTDKDVVFKVIKDLKFSQSSLSDNELGNLRKNLKIDTKLPESKLNIIYVPKYTEKESLAGIVLHRDTIFIFRKALDSLSEDKETLERLEKSTLMHEWGHLLGLEHSKNDDCIMSEMVEVYDRHMLGAKQIPNNYCQETIFKLKEIKSKNM